MSKKRRYRSTKKRMQAICRIVEAEYEPGDQTRCYKAIWRRRIWPEFGICYKTFLSYLDVPKSELEGEPASDEDPRQLSLF